MSMGYVELLEIAGRLYGLLATNVEAAKPPKDGLLLPRLRVSIAEPEAVIQATQK